MYRERGHEMRPPARQEPQGTQRYYAQHDFGSSAKITTTIVHAISDVTGRNVTDAELSLSDHVDPAALNSLFKPKPDGSLRFDSQLTFTMWGHSVTVRADGRILIDPPQPAPAGAGPQ